ncbi:hypothetical protein OAH34_01495, partial [bacterium]|nr:hypothetical protein [bacterium]
MSFHRLLGTQSTAFVGHRTLLYGGTALGSHRIDSQQNAEKWSRSPRYHHLPPAENEKGSPNIPQ